MRLDNSTTFVIVLWLLLLSQAAPVKAETRGMAPAPLLFKADRSRADLKRGVTVLSGHVEIRQDDILIQADVATLRKQGNKLDNIELQGNPVHWSMQTEDKKPLHAKAQKILYRPATDVVELFDQVVILQGEDRLQGDYFQLNRQTGELTGGQVDGGKGRVEILLTPPEKNKENPHDAPR